MVRKTRVKRARVSKRNVLGNTRSRVANKKSRVANKKSRSANRSRVANKRSRVANSKSRVANRKTRVRRRKNMKGGNLNLHERLKQAQENPRTHETCPLDFLKDNPAESRDISHSLIKMGNFLSKFGTTRFRFCENFKIIFFSTDGKTPMFFNNFDQIIEYKIRLFFKEVTKEGTETVSEVLYKEGFFSLNRDFSDEPVDGSFCEVLESNNDPNLLNLYVDFLKNNQKPQDQRTAAEQPDCDNSDFQTKEKCPKGCYWLTKGGRCMFNPPAIRLPRPRPAGTPVYLPPPPGF